jgi:hypothetical protein
MRCAALDIGDERDATGVVLVRGVIKADRPVVVSGLQRRSSAAGWCSKIVKTPGGGLYRFIRSGPPSQDVQTLQKV